MITISNREIFNNALALLCLDCYTGEDTDLSQRAPYLLASFCCSAKSIDKTLRKAHGLDAEPSFSSVYLSLENEFPLCEYLVPCASMYLAAMLVIDENPELSDSLYDKYCDSISQIMAEYSSGAAESAQAATCTSISEKYFYD